MSEKQQEIWVAGGINEKGTEMENKLYFVSLQNVSIVLWLHTLSLTVIEKWNKAANRSIAMSQISQFC